MIQGRYISDQDTANAPWAAVVDRTFAERYFPDGDAIGQSIRVTRVSNGQNTGFSEGQFREIVGIVENVREGYLVSSPPARVYHSYLQMPTQYPGTEHQKAIRMSVLVRTDALEAVAEPVRQAIQGLDETQVMGPLEPAEAVLADTVSHTYLYAQLLGSFAGIAVILAVIGIYGVMSFSVNQRRGEFGIRMALGARRGRILRHVIADAAVPTAIGLVIGLAVTFGMRNVLKSAADLTAMDPSTIGAITLILAATAVLAALVPARRAAAVEPMTILRHE